MDTVDELNVCATPMVNRIELCSTLSADDFVYGARYIDLMRADIGAANNAGLAGIVIGSATQKRELGVGVLVNFIRRADGICVTLHRVIDTLIDPLAAIDIAVAFWDQPDSDVREKTDGDVRCGLNFRHETTRSRSDRNNGWFSC